MMLKTLNELAQLSEQLTAKLADLRISTLSETAYTCSSRCFLFDLTKTDWLDVSKQINEMLLETKQDCLNCELIFKNDFSEITRLFGADEACIYVSNKGSVRAFVLRELRVHCNELLLKPFMNKPVVITTLNGPVEVEKLLEVADGRIKLSRHRAIRVDSIHRICVQDTQDAQQPTKKIKLSDDAEELASTNLDFLCERIRAELDKSPAVVWLDFDNKFHLVTNKGVNVHTNKTTLLFNFRMLDTTIKCVKLGEILGLYTVNFNREWKLVYSGKDKPHVTFKSLVGHLVDVKMKSGEEHNNVLFAQLEQGDASFWSCYNYKASKFHVTDLGQIMSITKSDPEARPYGVSCNLSSNDEPILTQVIKMPTLHEHTNKMYREFFLNAVLQVDDSWFELPLKLNVEANHIFSSNDYWFKFNEMTALSCLKHWSYVVHQITAEHKTPVMDASLTETQKHSYGAHCVFIKECLGALYQLTLILMKYKQVQTIGPEFKTNFTTCLDNLLVCIKRLEKTQKMQLNKRIFDTLFWFPVLRNICDLNWIINICMCYPDLFSLEEEQYQMAIDSGNLIGRDALTLLKNVCSNNFGLSEYIHSQYLFPRLDKTEQIMSYLTEKQLINLARRGVRFGNNINAEHYCAQKMMKKSWNCFVNCAAAGMKYDVKDVQDVIEKQ
jgi:hypothetical protein